MVLQTKTLLVLMFLLLFAGLSSGRVLRPEEGANISANPLSDDVVADDQVKMRRALQFDFTIDYEKEPGPNGKHEPPRSAKP